MPLKIWIILAFNIFNSCITVLAEDDLRFQEKNTYNNLEIIIDHQPIKNDQVFYAVCNITDNRRYMNCSVVLKKIAVAVKAETKVCQIDYRTKDDRRIIKNQFQLRFLYHQQLLFMWLDKERNDEKLNTTTHRLVLRTINMSTCKVKESMIDYQTGTDIFHVVSYTDTFNLFYPNHSLCEDKMCGQTYDLKGEHISGPVASYLPAKFFEESLFLCPAIPGTPFMGHLLFSSKLRLVSSRYGRVEELIDSSSIEAVATSDDNGLVGFCYHKRFNNRQIICSQYQAKNNVLTNHFYDLEFSAGRWMAMQNLGLGEMLLVTSQCDDETWCQKHFGLVVFHVARLKANGQHEDVLTFQNVDCNYAQDVWMDVNSKENGDVCISFVCRTVAEMGNVSYINVIKKCDNIRASEELEIS